MAPEQRERIEIDRQIVESGWVIQDPDEMNILASLGVAVREVKLEKGQGRPTTGEAAVHACEQGWISERQRDEVWQEVDAQSGKP